MGAIESLFGLSPVGAFMRSYGGPNDAATETKPAVIAVTHTRFSGNLSVKLAEITRKHPLYSARVYTAGEPPPPPAPKRTSPGLQVDQLFESFILSQRGAGGRNLVIIDRAVTGAASSNPLSWSKRTTLFRIFEIGLNGDTLSKREYATPTVPLTKAHVDAVVDSISHGAAVVSGKNWLASVSDIQQALYVPKTWPAVMALHVGIDGTLWLLQPQPPSRVARYWRIAADGKVLPAVSLNAGLRILRVSANRIWVVKEDGDGLPTIQIHDVVPLKQ